MKHLLTGVAMAAALAIAAPVWAQNAPGGNNPTSGSAGPFAPKAAPAPAAPAATPAPAKPMAAKPMHHHPMHHVSHRRGHMRSGDSMTEDLNRQELQRIMGGAPAPAPMPMPPGGNNPTSGSAGPFAPPPPAQR